MANINRRTNLLANRKINATTFNIGNRNRRTRKGSLTYNRRRIRLTLKQIKISTRHLVSGIVNNITRNKSRRNRLITLLFHLGGTLNRAFSQFNVNSQQATMLLRSRDRYYPLFFS